MKKILASVLTLAMTIALLSGCTGVPVAIDTPQQEVKEEIAETLNGDAVKTGLYVSANLTAENATAEAGGKCDYRHFDHCSYRQRQWCD